MNNNIRVNTNFRKNTNLRMNNNLLPSRLQVIHANLRDYMKNIWTDRLERELPTRFEVLGDLLVFPKNSLLAAEWTSNNSDFDDMWQTIMKLMHVTGVARKGRTNNDEFRSSGCVSLYGTTIARKRDHGVVYTWDITKCMFSNGNITEKARISSWDLSGQIVADLYAGIGYFTLPFLVNAKAKRVFAYEWNPDAFNFLLRNLELNNVAKKCVAIFGDNQKKVVEGVADHVNLGLLPSAIAGYPIALKALKYQGGILHVHGIVDVKVEDRSLQEFSLPEGISFHSSLNVTTKRGEWIKWAGETAVRLFTLGLQRENVETVTVEILAVQMIKTFGPRVDHLVADFEIKFFYRTGTICIPQDCLLLKYD